MPRTGGLAGWSRLLVAYAATMLLAGAFVLALAMSTQGLASALLPRRVFVRVSTVLQFLLFGALVTTYFLQPVVVRPADLMAVQAGGPFTSSPSMWFLGLFQQLAGGSILAVLAQRAWGAVALVTAGMMAAYAWSYVRAVRWIAEEPDVRPARPFTLAHSIFGDSLRSAVAQFGVRTVLRSAPHRMILAFYWGLAFAIAVVVLKTPRGEQFADAAALTTWDDLSVPLLFASLVTLGCAVAGARVAFAMPRELPANWIFRVAAIGGARDYLAARRRAMTLVSVVPVLGVWSIAGFWRWPWPIATGHLMALGVLGALLVEIALLGEVAIPCTCSYLPGRSRVHMAWLASVLLLVLAMKAAEFETEALQNPARFAAMMIALVIAVVAARWLIARSTTSHRAQPTFEDEGIGQMVRLELWDSRLTR